jgi:hypothetical protein
MRTTLTIEDRIVQELKALALEQGYIVHSADNDFRRFPGLSHINPLAG